MLSGKNPEKPSKFEETGQSSLRTLNKMFFIFIKGLIVTIYEESL